MRDGDDGASPSRGDLAGKTVGVVAFGPVASRSSGYHVRTHHLAESLAEFCGEVVVFEFTDPDERNPDSSETGHATESADSDYATIRLGVESERADDSAGLFEEYLTFDVLDAVRFQFESASSLWAIRSKLADCDAIVVGGALIPAGIVVSELVGTRTVLDTHCINKRLAEGYRDRNYVAYLLRSLLWDALERFGTNASDEVVVVSRREAEFVVAEYGVDPSDVHLIPNAVALPDGAADEETVESLRKRLGLDGKRVATFLGNLEAVQNRDAVEFLVEEVAPAVQRDAPEREILVVGKGPPDVADAPENVTFTGYVEDLDPYVALTDICIAPLRIGAGTKTKILTYMAYDEPVLTTPKGAEGLPIDGLPGVEVVPPESFADRLADANRLFEEYRGGNRAVVDEHYTAESIRDGLRDLLHQL